MSGAARRPRFRPTRDPAPPPGPPNDGGEFLLELLRRPPQSSPVDVPPHRPLFHHEDPAIAAVGPSHSLSTSIIPPWFFPPVLPHPTRFSPPGFPRIHPQFPPADPRSNDHVGGRPPQADAFLGRDFPIRTVQFGSFPAVSQPRSYPPTVEENGRAAEVWRSSEGGGSAHPTGLGPGGLEWDRIQPGGGRVVDPGKGKRREYRKEEGHHRSGSDNMMRRDHREEGNYRFSADVTRREAVGMPSNVKGGVGSNLDVAYGFGADSLKRGSVQKTLRIEGGVGRTGGLVESDLVEALPLDIMEEVEERISRGDGGVTRSCLEVKGVTQSEIVEEEEDLLVEQMVESVVLGEEHDGSTPKKKKLPGSRGKDYRLDTSRGHHVSSQAKRYRKASVLCRRDINKLTPFLLSIYESLIPTEEERTKQKQLLSLLQKLVNKEWPDAQLHIYGSCANSFGVSNSDIDICLAIDNNGTSKSDLLLKLADLLQSDNLQNVQALTHARVPIVKLMDPVTGISCDICMNNLLAVVNTKLLRDYAKIDERLRQLAFIVKHWAKSRHVNETYQGTLSSYAYVLMCIHFLQSRIPAILPCLQEMEATYRATVEGVECFFFDQVQKLQGFGSRNKESIAELVWGFFNYWAYRHDYANDVISVRVGGIIRKQEKDWTRRIGNDRHLICIEDPFETSHDLGRVVDKYSIKILREEFERAAEILQFDSNPAVTLFEPYIRESPPS